jgi:hypothetical protein
MTSGLDPLGEARLHLVINCVDCPVIYSKPLRLAVTRMGLITSSLRWYASIVGNQDPGLPEPSRLAETAQTFFSLRCRENRFYKA